MINFKLEEAIKKALEGQNFGNNKVIVITDTLGQVHVYEFDEDDYIEQIRDLESQVSDLEVENECLQERVEELEEEKYNE